jgi:site-specific recombinase XerD
MDTLSSYLAELSSNQTRRAYETDIQKFFEQKVVEKSDVEDIGPAAIQSYVRTMARDGQSVSTQRRRLAALRGFFDWLVRENVVLHNPARHPQVEPVRVETESSSEKLLSKDETEKLIEVAGESRRTGIRDQALILTIVYGALRRSEVATLKAEHVRPLGGHWILDLDDCSIATGYVRIPESVVEAIERVKTRHEITKGRLWRSVSNQNRGAPMTPDAIYKAVRRVSKQAGLDPVSIDTLRQTGLHLALEGGANISQVQIHGRFSDTASAARIHDSGQPSGTLGDSAAEHIDLNVADALPDQED